MYIVLLVLADRTAPSRRRRGAVSVPRGEVGAARHGDGPGVPGGADGGGHPGHRAGQEGEPREVCKRGNKLSVGLVQGEGRVGGPTPPLNT